MLTMLTSVKLKKEIVDRLGFFPAFLIPALETPSIFNSLWQSTRSLYLDNPLPTSFKEKLFVYLSGCCGINYFVICHSCRLRSLGMTSREILELNLLAINYKKKDLKADLELLAKQSFKHSGWKNDWQIENSLLHCALLIFVNSAKKSICCRQLKEVLGTIAYKHLIALLSYIKLCHQWLEGNPDISYEKDRRAQLHLAPLLLEEIELAEVFQTRNYSSLIEDLTSESLDKVTLTSAKIAPQVNVCRERFERCFIDAAFPMMISDGNGKIVHVNRNWTKITGYSIYEVPTLQEWTNKAKVKQQEIVHSHKLGWETETSFQQVVKALVNLPYSSEIAEDCQPQINQATFSEVTIITRSGERRFWDLYSAPLSNIDMGIELTLSIAKDVTNFILKETELTQVERKLDLILEATSAGNWEWNLLDNRVSVCSRARQLLKLDNFDGTYEGFLNSIHPLDRQLVDLAAIKAITNQSYLDIEYRSIGIDNRTNWLRIKAKSIGDRTGQTISLAGIVIDITSDRPSAELVPQLAPAPEINNIEIDRDRQKTEVIQALDELKNILNVIPYYLLVVNADTETITFCNRELAVSLGFSDPQAICGKTIEQCFSPENARHITQQYRQVLQSGETLRVQESLVLPDGKHYFDTTIAPLKTSNGRFYALLHTCSDIPDLVITTQETLSHRTAQLEAANKELESFSYSVSHDLQAPLRVINGFSQVIWENYQEVLDERGKHYLQRIQANSERMSQSIDALLQLSRVTRTQMHLSQVNLSEMVREIASELTANDPIRSVKLAIAPEVSVKGDPMLLRIMLSNLLENAWKYTSKREFATIEFGSLCQNDRLTCFVRDNGAGFNPEYAQKLFKAFQRLHSETDFPGMGIGLATVQRIIYRHGGKVWADGECDRGASFYFTL